MNDESRFPQVALPVDGARPALLPSLLMAAALATAVLVVVLDRQAAASASQQPAEASAPASLLPAA